MTDYTHTKIRLVQFIWKQIQLYNLFINADFIYNTIDPAHPKQRLFTQHERQPHQASLVPNLLEAPRLELGVLMPPTTILHHQERLSITAHPSPSPALSHGTSSCSHQRQLGVGGGGNLPMILPGAGRTEPLLFN